MANKSLRLLHSFTLLAALIFFQAGCLRASAQPLPFPPYPVTAFENREEGGLIVEVKFGPDGKVESCRVIKSLASLALETATVRFIERRWSSPVFAGTTQIVPITYVLPAFFPGHQIPDMAPPPQLLSPGAKERDLTLRLAFGSNGWVKNFWVIKSSGSASVDSQTELWVMVHWHHDAYANQVIDAPFQFKPPPPAPGKAAPPPRPTSTP